MLTPFHLVDQVQHFIMSKRNPNLIKLASPHVEDTLLKVIHYFAKNWFSKLQIWLKQTNNLDKSRRQQQQQHQRQQLQQLQQ